MAPDLPSDKTFDQLVSTLKRHFEPKPLIIAERFYFHKRSQNIGESVSEYVAELRRLTTHCQYGTHLTEALRDWLVSGIRDAHTQKKLLTVEPLTLAQAIDIAQGEEAVERNSRALKGTEPTVNMVTKSVAKPCYRCGNTSHDQKDCHFKNTDCFHCGKRGHIADVCRSKKMSRSRQISPRNTPSPRYASPRHINLPYPTKKESHGTKYVSAARDTHDYPITPIKTTLIANRS